MRLIDTPGIGDTRGYDRDKKNMQNILKHISHLESLHGIVVLLKSNNARLSTAFQFCIQEIMTALHIDARHITVLCLTNSRETMFSPEETLTTLNILMKQIAVDINTSIDNVYGVDNEAVRYLAAK